MNTDEPMTDPERLKLLHEWLECSDQAGNDLWFASGFLEECIGMVLPSLYRKRTQLKGARLDLDNHYIKGVLPGWLWKEVVYPWKKNKSPENFSTLENCRNLMRTTVANRAVDFFKEEMGLDKDEKNDPVVSGDAEDEKESSQQRFKWKNREDVSSAESTPPEPEEEPAQPEQLPPLATLQAFHDWLVEGRTDRATILNAAVHFFSEGEAETASDLKENDIAAKIIDTYLDEKVKDNPPAGLYDHLKACGKSQPSKYTGDLRTSWREFRDGEGAEFWTAYSKHRVDVNTEFSPYVSDSSERPLWGRIDFGLEDFDRLVEKLLEHTQALQTDGGGVLAVPHDRWQEPSIRLLLSLFLYTVHSCEGTGTVRLLQPDLEPHRLEEALDADILVVSHLPRLPGLLSHLESSPLEGKVVVGTGIEEEWQRTSLSFNHRVLDRLPEVDDLTAWMAKIVEEEVRKYTERSRPAQRLYEMVAVWDARAVPLRFDVLARALEMDGDVVQALVDELVEDGLLYWVNPWMPENRRVATKSPVVARKVVEELAKLDHEGQDIRLDCFHTVLKNLNPQREAERSLMLQLFGSAVPQSRAWQQAAPAQLPQEGRSWANTLIRNDKRRPYVQRLFEEMDPDEAVLWSRTLARLRLFDKAENVLESAIRRHRTNARLLHARAQTLADQVQLNASLALDAEKAFENAASQAPGNCYIYQSWAIMRAKAGGDPTPGFKDALRAATSPGERAAVHLAWADYETERGKYRSADDHLKKAERETPDNAYVPHVRGKAAFQQGEYAAANEHFHRVLNQKLHNVPALNALGYMARQRGHMGAAQQHLEEAHRIDPENVPTLHERGNLLRDIADAEARKEDGDDVAEEEARGNACDWYEDALDLEQDNVQVRVSYANALLPQAVEASGTVRDKMKRLLNSVLNKLDPSNARALHVFSRFHRRLAQRAFKSKRVQEQRSKAQEYLQEILDNDAQNLAALHTLADLHLDAGNEKAARNTLDVLERCLTRPSRPQHERIRGYNACARVEERLGELEQAIKQADQALDLDPENLHTQQLLRQLRSAAMLGS